MFGEGVMRSACALTFLAALLRLRQMAVGATSRGGSALGHVCLMQLGPAPAFGPSARRRSRALASQPMVRRRSRHSSHRHRRNARRAILAAPRDRQKHRSSNRVEQPLGNSRTSTPIYGGLTVSAAGGRNPSHDAPARTSPDARPAAEKHRLDMAMVRALPASCADAFRSADRAGGAPTYRATSYGAAHGARRAATWARRCSIRAGSIASSGFSRFLASGPRLRSARLAPKPQALPRTRPDFFDAIDGSAG
jgi:hypothetical protein